MKSIVAIAPIVIICSGCASVMNDTTHPMKIETIALSGELVVGADCTLKNDKAVHTVKSGELANVRRSSEDLDVICRHPANPEAIAKATSRANAGLFGNILIGGGIGALVDHGRGTAYTYPTWIRLIFGRVLAFDRADEKDGNPVEGRDPNVSRKDPPKENLRATHEQQQRW